MPRLTSSEIYRPPLGLFSVCLIVAVAAVVNQIRPVVQLLDHIRLSEPEFMSIYIYI